MTLPALLDALVLAYARQEQCRVNKEHALLGAGDFTKGTSEYLAENKMRTERWLDAVDARIRIYAELDMVVRNVDAGVSLGKALSYVDTSVLSRESAVVAAVASDVRNTSGSNAPITEAK